MTTSEPSGKKVVELRSVTHGYDGNTLIKDLNLKIFRGDRIGLVGNNGVGKSTLLSILLGQLEPDEGSVKLGTHLDIAYFDQLRETLDPNKSVMEYVGEGKEYLDYGGKQRHIISYLQQFLFSPQRAMTKIKALSGGESNRVMLAKLFTKPSNLLVLDEPSNDLDVEMLEALEQRLVDYDGTILLVSHDREFLDNVVTSILVFEEDGHVQEYVGGYKDWQVRQKSLSVAETKLAAEGGASKEKEPSKSGLENNFESGEKLIQTRKLSFTETHELSVLPAQLEKLETDIAGLQEEVNSADFYSKDQDHVAGKLSQLNDLSKELERLTERWLELEELSG